MSNNHPRIYLASQSPRRRELLKQIGVHFDVLLLRTATHRHVDVDETPHQEELPEIYVQRLCREKAQAGYATLTYRKLTLQPVLAADTTVTLNGEIFGKPQNAEQAAAMLRALSGRDHQVLTAVALALGEHVEVRLSVSTVRFTQLSDERIAHYLEFGEYSDKAGGYGIQGHAAAFIEHLAGSYSGVMGLPIFETVQLLKHFDIPTP
jgi:septum formation protein